MDKTSSTHSVFVVDDDTEDFEVFSDIILEKRPSLTLKHFSDSTLFVKVLEDIPLPGLLVLDINMPKLSGFEVLKNVNLALRWKNVPVIFLTTSHDSSIRDKATLLGAVNLFVKPITSKQWEELINVIDSMIANPA